MRGLRSPGSATGFLGVLVLFVATGLVAAVVWEALWTPPTGIALDHTFYLDEDGLGEELSGTVIFVLVGVAAGLLAGFVAAWWLRARPISALVGAVVGSVLGTAVMAWVGPLLGPPDPSLAASTAPGWTPLVDQLRLVGLSCYLFLPGGALLGLLAAWGFQHLAERRRSHRVPTPESGGPTTPAGPMLAP